jgi:four helix bundle protein
MQDYRQLRVHANAHALAIKVRAAIRSFPRSGYASLKRQMTSAAESVAFNIVEGCVASSQKEFARFLDIAIKSATELEAQLSLARDYGVLPKRVWEKLKEDTIDVRRMLFGLRAKILSSISAASAVTQKRTTEQRKTHSAKESP